MGGALGRSGLVVGASDRICAPEYKLAPRIELLYPSIQTPWRYPNSGGFGGTAVALVAFFHRLVHGVDGGSFSQESDDQLRVQQFLLACSEQKQFPFRLDDTCTIFQCMGEPERGWDFEHKPLPRILNCTTRERPVAVHGCGGHGRWFLAEIYTELSLMEHLELCSSDLADFDFAGLVAPGDQVSGKHWVDQPPWKFPFQLFDVIRSNEWKNLSSY